MFEVLFEAVFACLDTMSTIFSAMLFTLTLYSYHDFDLAQN